MRLSEQYRQSERIGRKPTSPLARAMFDALDWLDGRRVHDVEGLNLRSLRVRAHSAMVRYESGRAVADGRPRGGDADGAGSRSKGALTSVEAAVESRVFGTRQPEDPVHSLAHRVASEIARAAAALQSAVNACNALDATAADVPAHPSCCDLCREAGLKDPRAFERYGDVGGKLSTPMWLCMPHVLYVSRNGHAPTPEQTRYHDEHGSWRVKVA